MTQIEYWIWICPKCGAEFLVPRMFGLDGVGMLDLSSIEPCPGGPRGEFPGGPPGGHSSDWAAEYISDCPRIDGVFLEDDVDLPLPEKKTPRIDTVVERM